MENILITVSVCMYFVTSLIIIPVSTGRLSLSDTTWKQQLYPVVSLTAAAAAQSRPLDPCRPSNPSWRRPGFWAAASSTFSSSPSWFSLLFPRESSPWIKTLETLGLPHTSCLWLVFCCTTLQTSAAARSRPGCRCRVPPAACCHCWSSPEPPWFLSSCSATISPGTICTMCSLHMTSSPWSSSVCWGFLTGIWAHCPWSTGPKWCRGSWLSLRGSSCPSSSRWGLLWGQPSLWHSFTLSESKWLSF